MSTLIYLTSSSYSSLTIKEALDMALVFGTFEQEVAIAVTGGGLTLVREGQTPREEHGKHLFKLLDGLEFYDIDKLYVRADESTHLALWEGITTLSDTEWQQIFSQYQHVLRF